MIKNNQYIVIGSGPSGVSCATALLKKKNIKVLMLDTGYELEKDLELEAKELYKTRNFGPALNKYGTILGGAFAFFDQNIMQGRFPFTWHNKNPDHEAISYSKDSEEIRYPKPDGIISFDRLSSVFLSQNESLSNIGLLSTYFIFFFIIFPFTLIFSL